MKRLKQSSDSRLYNKGSKKFVASLLSDPKKSMILTKNDLVNIIRRFDNSDLVFYQSKITKQKMSKKPKDYTTKDYRKFTDAPPLRKSALKKLNNLLTELPAPDYLFSRTERGFLKNAKRHYGQTHFLLMDISSFFPNCSFKSVKEFFMSASGFLLPIDTAECLAQLCTTPINKDHRYREVPQGFSTSCLLCFFAYRKMFNNINNLAVSSGLKFSTYVDDLTFSSNKEFDYETIKQEVITILNNYGHTSKNEKCKYYDITKTPHAPIITGIWLKRYKLRASGKIYKTMITNYRYLVSNPIIDEITYIKSWKAFVKLNGILQTINYIEPQTKNKREYIITYANSIKGYFLPMLSPNNKRFNTKAWKGKIFQLIRTIH